MADTAALIQPDQGQDATLIHLVNKDGFDNWAKKLSAPQRAALKAQKFDGSGYQVGIVPDGDGWFAVGGVANPDKLSSWCMAKLAEVLPEGTYRRADGQPGPALHGWQTAQYRFERYKKPEQPVGPRILLTKEAGADYVKTSTGFASGGATAEDIAMIREVVGPELGIKASGGVKDFADAEKMVFAGATRIGASAGVKIVQGEREKTGTPLSVAA